MKRRDFFKKGTKGALAATIIPISGNAFAQESKLETETNIQTNNKGVEISNRKKTLNYDVAVLGAGLAGICAAVSAARNGVKTCFGW